MKNIQIWRITRKAKAYTVCIRHCDLPYVSEKEQQAILSEVYDSYTWPKILNEHRITALMQDLWSSVRVVQCWANYHYMCTSATAVLIDLPNTQEAKTFMCVWVIMLCYQAVKNSPKMHHVKDAQYFSNISNLIFFVCKNSWNRMQLHC